MQSVHTRGSEAYDCRCPYSSEYGCTYVSMQYRICISESLCEIVGVNLTHSYQRNSLPMEREELAACTIKSLVRASVKQSLQNAVLCNTKMRQFIKRNKIQLMNLTCLDEDGVLVVPTKEQVLYMYIVSYACRVLEFMYMYKYVHNSAIWPW